MKTKTRFNCIFTVVVSSFFPFQHIFASPLRKEAVHCCLVQREEWFIWRSLWRFRLEHQDVSHTLKRRRLPPRRVSSHCRHLPFRKQRPQHSVHLVVLAVTWKPTAKLRCQTLLLPSQHGEKWSVEIFISAGWNRWRKPTYLSRSIRTSWPELWPHLSYAI